MQNAYQKTKDGFERDNKLFRDA